MLFSITNIYNSKNKDAFILEVNLHIVHVVFRKNLNICLKFNKISACGVFLSPFTDSVFLFEA